MPGPGPRFHWTRAQSGSMYMDHVFRIRGLPGGDAAEGGAGEAEAQLVVCKDVHFQWDGPEVADDSEALRMLGFR